MVKDFKSRERWDNISATDVHDLSENLSGLAPYNETGDELAKRFDLLALNFQLVKLSGDKSKEEGYVRQIYN
ncbi:hypothetical protein NLM59_11645, partial [Weeksellaceae bacterium KMM 9724]